MIAGTPLITVREIDFMRARRVIGTLKDLISMRKEIIAEIVSIKKAKSLISIAANMIKTTRKLISTILKREKSLKAETIAEANSSKEASHKKVDIQRRRSLADWNREEVTPITKATIGIMRRMTGIEKATITRQVMLEGVGTIEEMTTRGITRVIKERLFKKIGRADSTSINIDYSLSKSFYNSKILMIDLPN